MRPVERAPFPPPAAKASRAEGRRDVHRRVFVQRQVPQATTTAGHDRSARPLHTLLSDARVLLDDNAGRF